MPSRRSGGTGAVAVLGLSDLRRALRRVDGSAGRDLTRAIRGIAGRVRDKARSNISHRTGRHGDPNLPSLASTVRVSVRQGGASVYSNQPYAGVQERGGRVGRDHATVLPRARASRYMTRAVQSEQPEVSARLDGLLQSLGREFEK